MKNNTLYIKNIIKNFDEFMDRKIRIRGRVLSVRKMKHNSFIDIYDKDHKIQINIKNNTALKMGDLIQVYGKCIYTETKEKTILAERISVINKWLSGDNLKSDKKNSPINSFKLNQYNKIFIPNFLRLCIRKFLTSIDYFEVQTPILLDKYNGGRSFPVTSSCLEKHLGFNRTTMEEKMQAIVASGFDNIFQIGSIFRSNRENTFLELYSTELNWSTGKDQIKDLLSYVLQSIVEEFNIKNHKIIEKIIDKNWIEVDFFEQAKELFDIDCMSLWQPNNNTLIEKLYKKNIIKNKDISPEAFADELGSEIAVRFNEPIIVNGFPSWSSPLYANKNKIQLQRSRIYIPGQKGGFELGMQENKASVFTKKIKNQSRNWGLDCNTKESSDLSILLSGGMPKIFGFAMSPDKIIKIWTDDYSINPFD